ncbi:polyribonucleotide nucleotidyltransferase [Campylobacter canadensis]|uniref:Polyribonucleotide nucleotidyltransferase n=1 Tax=Campylobacter canadensis TaxID=449520 RepID=A0ABS7WTJ9_9BACT|nr:polyribonucleotide nucleotidyltransferase [Campylobacter canadensis]MBZ7988105.1 polyribonucleotide nucleotidyltransferase [Campylobacter canadensis]MBZ7999080.1 polyribonucleotide nucleotidyltransferase [Campylobacter canadensis]
MKKSIIINNKELIFDLDLVAKQANASVLLTCGKTVLLASVAREDSKVSEDFLPLTVSYVEKTYAAGKIPGGFVKRETKPSEAETLTARIIDRTLRPLFADGYLYPTHIVVMLLSCELDVDLQPLALYAASAALSLSDIEVKNPAVGIRIAKDANNEFIINPTLSELENSSLDLFVSGAADELLMIEMKANETNDSMNELSEEELIKALNLAKNEISKISAEYKKVFYEHKKSFEFDLKAPSQNADIYEFLEKNYLKEVKQAINNLAKSERNSELNKIADEILQNNPEFNPEELNYELHKFKKSIVRKQILNEKIRADGRGLDEVRPISILTNILPNAHGSCLFTRGQTQALVVATLGSANDAQTIENLTLKNSSLEKFMFNYNFPGFCVGEASALKAPSRRELGHGNLAKRALSSSVSKNYPHTIRLVSEILESNGSSSMASVCGGSLALKAAGVDSKKLVAGVAMGLIVEDDNFAVLTDIMGLEDHDGDMDFKVAGSKDGITAMQMDIKLGGISPHILELALEKAKNARLHILDIMQKANDEIVVNYDILPKLSIFKIHPNDIPELIGQGGKTIKDIIEKFEISIDIDRDKEEVTLSGQKVEEAKEYIFANVLKKHRKKVEFNVGEEYKGIVKKIAPFGAFVSLKDGVDGLLHSSKIKNLNLKEGDELNVVVSEIKDNKVGLNLV